MMQLTCPNCGCIIVASLQRGQTTFSCPYCLVRFERCPRCKWYSPTVTLWRTTSHYERKEDNYTVCCESCFKEIEEYWQERWEDYHNDIIGGLW